MGGRAHLVGIQAIEGGFLGLLPVIGLSYGSWICRKEIAFSVEMAGTSLTGMKYKGEAKIT